MCGKLRIKSISRTVVASFALLSAGLVMAAESHPTMARNVAEMQFVAFPGMPTCTSGAVQSGDPGKGPSVILSKMAAGCTIPWHWHTPSEHVMMVSGVGRMEMKGGAPVTLQAGGFALMPSRHLHQFTCVETCLLFVHSDAAFDLHYVDAKGQEITPDEALKAVNETAVAAPEQ